MVNEKIWLKKKTDDFLFVLVYMETGKRGKEILPHPFPSLGRERTNEFNEDETLLIRLPTLYDS